MNSNEEKVHANLRYVRKPKFAHQTKISSKFTFLYFKSNTIRVTNKEDKVLGYAARMQKTGDAYKIIIGLTEWKKMERSKSGSEAPLKITACEDMV